MRKATSFILGVMAALCSGQAFADPPGQMKMQTIISPPVWAESLNCAVLNLSDREISAQFTLANKLSDEPTDEKVILPGWVAGLGDPIPLLGFCIVEWYGKPGELVGSACASASFDGGYGCLELREFDNESNQD